MTTVPHVLIVGAGSAGKRHARNLSALGCLISAVDPREDRLGEIGEQVPLSAGFPALDVALDEADITGVVVCSPPCFHVEQAAAALGAGVPVLLEKPSAPDEVSARRLVSCVDRSGVPLLLGYTWRWWPPLREVRQRLEQHAIGDLLHVRCSLSAHLADWHPWERYQDFFMASVDLGGGALLDESHWIDLMLWLFGHPSSVFAQIDRLSSLEIEADDNVDMLLEFPAGPRVLLHLDLYGRPHERYVQFVGDAGTLYWSDEPNGFRIGWEPTGPWGFETYTCERNDMFVAVAKEFLEVIAGRCSPSCTAADGLRVLQVIEAARLSHRERRLVDLVDPLGGK